MRTHHYPILEENVSRAVEVLELADQFFLDHLKQSCELFLAAAVRVETFESLLLVAQKTNAVQLEKCCRHFARNRMEAIFEDAIDDDEDSRPVHARDWMLRTTEEEESIL